MRNNKYLLMAMLKKAGYKTSLGSAKLDEIINKFSLNLNVKPDALALQVNKLINTPKFNQHMQLLHSAEYGANAKFPTPRPIPAMAPSISNKEEEKFEQEYRARYLPKPRPTPY